MIKRLLAAGLALAAVVACSADREVPSAGVDGRPLAAGQMPRSLAVPQQKRTAAAFASLPDRGDLVAYLPGPPIPRVRSTWHPVAVSEEHALRALVTGVLRLTLPGGEIVDYRYERHVEHPDGNWTWVGAHPAGGAAKVVITFGEHAVFGTIRRTGATALQLTTHAGKSWIVEHDPGGARWPGDGPVSDSLVPPARPTGTAASSRATAGGGSASAPVVDLVVGYTTGFAADLGGVSQAGTRLAHLIALTNESYADSGLDARLRLVRTVQVSYPDATENNSALQELAGVEAATPASLLPLLSARDQYGGDLVALVRKFHSTENVTCGNAYVLGAYGGGVDPYEERYAYSVVSDGIDHEEGYYCYEETLAHELGHNMGQVHNGEDSSFSGAHYYSYGYRESSSTGFFTIMAYPMGESQYLVPHFANPQVAADGRTTGVAEESDNVRSMAQTIPAITQFRGSAVTFEDVQPEHWAYTFIERLYDAGITGGCATSPRLFCPADPVSRAEMAVFLLRARHGRAYVPPAATGFYDDVLTTHWAANWIERLRAEGISGGCQSSPPMYCPGAAVTRDQMAVFLLRAKYGSFYVPPRAQGIFEDVPTTHWAAAWIERLAAEGVTGGCSTAPRRFCPSAVVTRDQMAVFLVRNFGL